MIYDLNVNSINIELYLLKMIIISIGTSKLATKIANQVYSKKLILLARYLIIVLISMIVTYIKYKINVITSIVFFIILLSLLNYTFNKIDISYSILSNAISLSINYIMWAIASTVVYLINIFIIKSNDLINLMIITIAYSVIFNRFIKIKKIKNGFSFFNRSGNYFNALVFNISICILFSVVIIDNIKNLPMSELFVIALFIFSLIMLVSVKKSIEAYYKQKLLIQDLNETKKELDEKKNEIKELEAENLKISKKAHSLAHKQKSLEFKINKILMNTESAEELGLKNELKNISKELIKSSQLPKLNKTGISEIDDMFNVMQEECRLNKIDFFLQIKGNIYQMTNHYITKEELSILLADHIKDAIIAINHSDNINKSIMVRLGKIEDCFAVYFYDSGVEFTKEVLENLGKKPITTYSDEGGTGMGFMNTFDLLNKYNASLIIEKIGSPCKDNYTKIIKIKFDNKKKLII